MTYKDFTIKARLKDFSKVETLLNNMNSTYIGLDEQTDYYFETNKGKLKLRQGTIENLITHYERVVEAGIEKTIVYKYDKDPSAEQITRFRQGKKLIGIVEKTRKIYTLNNLKIHLDKMRDGQCFLEIEAIDLENTFTDNELVNQCMELQSKLEISDDDLIMTGYLDK